MAQPERRYDVTPVMLAGTYLVSNRRCIGGRGVQENWIRRQVWNAGRKNGWLCCGHRGAHVMRRRWRHRGRRHRHRAQQANCPRRRCPCRLPRGPQRALRFPVQRRRSRVPYSHRAGQQRSRHLLKSRHRRDRRRRIPRGHRSARRPHPTQTVTAAPSPSTVTRSVTISPVADCKPVAVLVRGGRVCRNKRSFLVLVGTGGFVACRRGSDAPSRAGTPSTGLEG